MSFDRILERVQAQAKKEKDEPAVTGNMIVEKAEAVGKKIADLGFDDTCLKNHRIISRYLANMILGTADRGLFITGSVGTGKTLAMMLIQKQTMLRRRTAGFVTSQEFANKVS